MSQREFGLYTSKSILKNEDKIFAELVKLLYVQAKGAILGALVTASCLVIGLYQHVPNSLLFSWFSILILISLARIQIVNIYLRAKPSCRDAIYWRNIFLAITIASGLAWMFVGTFVVTEDNNNETLITLAIAGIAAGSIPYFAASRLVSNIFILLILPFFGFKMLLHVDKAHHVIGSLTFVYLAILLLAAYRIHNVLYEAIKFKFQNDELVTQLSASKNEIEAINKELKSENLERKEIENLLRNSEEQYRLVTNALPVLIAYIDNDGIFRFNNSAYESWFSKPLSEITGKPIKDVIGETAYANYKEHHESLLIGKQVTYETAMYFHAEQERFVSVTLIPHMQATTLKGIFSLISDVTPRINFLATHDALTNLPNRRLFTIRFTHALANAQSHGSKLALLFLDLDHFKNVNDTLGHDVGDQLLIKAVERIQGCVREDDTIARLGGDEFIILLHLDHDMNRPAIVAKKLCDVLSMGFNIADRDIFITTSIGISLYPDDGDAMGVLLKNADMAMYRAKDRGRNTYEFYTHSMNEVIQKKLKIETHLRNAIENNELKLYYQPIISMKNRSIVGLESLLRWQHPEMGMISPMEFIPIAEETDLIIPIGEWVLRSVCQQQAVLKRLGYNNLNLSVNISARQFARKNLVSLVKRTLESTGISGESLTLELTETLIMRDIEHSIEVVKALKKLDIRISIDDFGTGYSSLNYLKNFPFDIIKIDRSFVTDCSSNNEDAAIVKAIITLAHNLKMQVVAEGVETVEQYQFLSNHSCDQVQGFLFYRPMPEVDIEHVLKTHNVENLAAIS